ncbi:circularly permuted type 2 ATP-grasp protein [Ottowia sp.]|uniref:circularly permuted type 2 ATP-grasp protein n=1 Tax=Ottowia sp. TaxID=1898956 RepID=UPI002B5D5341|nr:circularly permuted type 2 ATP-grasp protein [Ottowia sp.]HRN76225.1 circularly permuted type 2 ATP-grasp protein [Ottowia sp.]
MPQASPPSLTIPLQSDPGSTDQDSGVFDELHGRTRPAGEPAAVISRPDPAAFAPHWRRFFGGLGPDGWHDLDRRASALRRHLRDNGVTYNVYADEAKLQRPWPLELFPLLLPDADWQRIEAGVLQRVRLLEAVMHDLYGERRLLKDGLIPAALVQGHPDYLRAMHGVPAVGGTYLHIAAFDLARDAHGDWWVVSQRTQAPSGLGYLLENRAAVSAQFADSFDSLRVRRLAASYRGFIEGLKAQAPGGADSHIALLTPGPYNETYFEQSYLARYLGVTLVEGNDLTVRGERLYLKTLHGLRPVHGLIKRVDDAYLDPLEMRPESQLGVPGLLQAVRAGTVLVANAPGAGLLESSALLGFLPALSRQVLGEPLRLPSLHTWWCGEPATLREVLPQLARCVIKPTYPWSTSRGTFGPGVGPLMSPEVLQSWADSIQRVPEEHTVQAFLAPSLMPTWTRPGDAGGLLPRPTMLRVFALSDGSGRWSVLPGGMTRLVSASAGLATMALGGSSADTWVLPGAAAPPQADPEHEAGPHADRSSLVAITPADTALVQRERLITSRAAEGLFWLGRYTERAENGARLAGIVLNALHGEEEPSPAVLMWLEQLAAFAGLVPPGTPSPLHDRAAFERALIQSLPDTEGTPGIGYTLRRLYQVAASLRERLSPEHWSFIKQARENWRRAGDPSQHGGEAASADAARALAQLSHTLAAVTGAQQDRMWRDDGWRLLTVGRQLERLLHLSDALSKGFYTNAVHDAAGYGVVLELFDSTISFHARHQRSRSIAALIEHVVLNQQNPRSLGGALQLLQDRLARLRQHDSQPLDLPPLHGPVADELPRLCEADAIGDFIHLQARLAQLMAAGARLSDEIGLRHFSHAGEEHTSLGA